MNAWGPGGGEGTPRNNFSLLADELRVCVECVIPFTLFDKGGGLGENTDGSTVSFEKWRIAKAKKTSQHLGV